MPSVPGAGPKASDPPAGACGDPPRRVGFDTLGPVGRTRLAGVVLVVVSAIAFGSGGLFALPVYEAGVDWLTLMAWRFAIAGGLAWLVLLVRPGARRALEEHSGTTQRLQAISQVNENVVSGPAAWVAPTP